MNANVKAPKFDDIGLTKDYFSKCQVDTPPAVVELTWKMVHQRKASFAHVIDLGAGDGRFSTFGNYGSYHGIEYDPVRIPKSLDSAGASIIQACAFSVPNGLYDLCIGNPPFVRHHDADKLWYRAICSELERELGFELDYRSNVFLLFLAKAILTTKKDGIVALIIPYEWVSRPSAKKLREYIKFHQWEVSVHRFTYDVFPRVLTTASITIIDKSKNNGKWKYYKINESELVVESAKASGTEQDVIAYSRRSVKDLMHAQRGLSPGGQKIFCLTEGERIHYGLKIGVDVTPCITTLKHVPISVTSLNEHAFKKYYVNQGVRCWLIKPQPVISEELKWYLSKVPEKSYDNYTCRRQTPWWNFRPHNPPSILYGSGFTSFGPKFLVNDIRAIAVGGIHGVHQIDVSPELVLQKLKSINFEEKLVSHSGKLKKVEVGQMNTILEDMQG